MKDKQLMILSFDRPTFPKVDLSFLPEVSSFKLTSCWYRNDGRYAILNKDILDAENAKIALNNTAKRESYSAGGLFYSLEKVLVKFRLNNRDWIMAINLLDPKKIPDHLFSTPESLLKPGSSNQKIYGNWLMAQFANFQASALSEIGWPVIYDLLGQIDIDNPCTALMTDGQDYVVFQGSNFFHCYYYLRSCPPHEHCGFFKTGHLQFQIDALDLHHTFIMVSSAHIEHNESRFLNLKQMLVIRDGNVIWNKDPQTFMQEKTITQDTEQTSDYLQRVSLLPLPCHFSAKVKKNKMWLPTTTVDRDTRLYSVTHESVYDYESPVYLSKHLFRLQPINDLLQTLLHYELSISLDGQVFHGTPGNFTSAFGNAATYIEIDKPYQHMEVICHSLVNVATPPTQSQPILNQPLSLPLIWMPWDRIMMQAYLVPPELPESELSELSDYAMSFVKRNNNDVYAVLNDINRTIHQDYAYVSGSTTLATTPYEVYINHRGVCQDFANLFICLARLLNIPARYRTGYIYTATDYENQEQGDASHAWLEVYLPYCGWLGYDPTNFCLAGKNHIRVACGRTYFDTAPTSGTIFRGGGGEKLSINVRVIREDAVDIDSLI